LGLPTQPWLEKRKAGGSAPPGPSQDNADGLLANAQQRLEEAEDREALLHACEESADSHAEGLNLQEAGFAVREAEARDCERELRLQEEQLHALEDRLNREREALERREEMFNQANSDLARHQETLNLRESSLQERMDRMLNQRWISLEQEFERRRTKNIEACHADFRSKTDAALVRYKQGRETLERQVRDLEVELKGVHEVCRGAKIALAEANATINTLRCDALRLEEENTVMVQQIMEISRELQEARDSEAEARMLRRQRLQMFRGFSARIMEAVNRLGIEGLNLATIPEDDGSILHFFSQLAEASAKVLELVDAECRELLGLAGTRIFSNIQRLSPDLDLEEVL
jgi:chromosome segregation ATPase